MGKKFLLKMVLLSVFCSSMLLAQLHDPIDWEVKRLGLKLELSEEQVERVREIFRVNMAEMDRLREQNRGNPDAIRSAEKDIEDAMRGQIRAVLTAEQEEKFKEIREWIRLPRLMHDNRMKEMKDRLKLTEEQSTRIEQIMLEERDKMESMRGFLGQERGMAEERNKMNSMREPPGSDREGRSKEIEKIRQEMDQKIEALLTPEQIKEYQKMKKEREQEMREPRPGMGERPSR
jgi:Spy/CpxP family protein refolding chaperone